MGKKGGRGGRKVGGGGRRHANKDHRQSGLKHTVNKGRWDDICARQLAPGVAEKVLAEKTVPDPDLPGLGQYFCIACSKYCISAQALADHQRTPKHRRRTKTLTTEKIYDHAEANAGAGRGSIDNGLQEREGMAVE